MVLQPEVWAANFYDNFSEKQVSVLIFDVR